MTLQKLLLTFLTGFIFLFTVTGCNNTLTPKTPEKNIDSPIGKDCFSLCHTKIKKLCPDFSMDIDKCEEACKSWTDRNIECMSTAIKCDQINLENGTCRTEDIDNPFEYEKVKPINYNCSKACYKYKKCAAYTDGATTEDTNAAFNSCFEECQKWSDQTIKCMSRVHVNSAMDCMKVTQCGLNQYLGHP